MTNKRISAASTEELAAIRQHPTDQLCGVTGLDKRTVQTIKAGDTARASGVRLLVLAAALLDARRGGAAPQNTHSASA